jgi:hypothetical protein
VVPAIVSAVVWALLDYASQAEERGSTNGFDIETYAAFSGLPESEVLSVIDALRDKGVIGPDGGFKNWGKRQPRREDGSAERAKEWRERNRTQPNATEPKIREDTDTDTDTDTEQNKDMSAEADVSVPKKSKSKKRAAPDYTENFNLFWSCYPSRPGASKVEAFVSFARLAAIDQEAAIDGAIAFADLCRKNGTEERFICHPVVFLNQRRWESLAA